MINPKIKIKINFFKKPEKKWLKEIQAELVNSKNNNFELSLKKESDIPSIIYSAINYGGKILECIKSEESLLEIFTRLTKQD